VLFLSTIEMFMFCMQWDGKDATAGGGPRYQTRTYYSMCQLHSNEYPGRTTDQYILVAILSTMCKDNRNDFLVYNKAVKDIEIWEGTERIKHYWCAPEVPIGVAALGGVDLSLRRLVLFKRKSWIKMRSY